MTVQEFSDQFDVLLDSYKRFKSYDDRQILDSVEFNEYEKSVFLTKSQETLIKECYSGTITGVSFEQTEKLREELDALIVQEAMTKETNTSNSTLNPYKKDKYKHSLYKHDSTDCWYVIYEQVVFDGDDPCIKDSVVDVLPVTHDDYSRIVKNPFRGPNSRRVLRLNPTKDKIELISLHDIKQYIVRYIKKPEPIVLENLPNDLTIDGVKTSQTCKLSESLHQLILDGAVKLALQSVLTTNSKSNDD